MKHPTPFLTCDRCARSTVDRPEARFRFCPGCSLYVCDRCWSYVASQCQACSRPGLAPSELPGSRSIRDTIAPPLIGNPRLTDPQPAGLRTRAERPLPRARVPATLGRPTDATPGSRAVGMALSLGRRLLMAASLAVAGMAVVWAVDLSMNSGIEPADPLRTMEGTLSGTPPATEAVATAAPSASTAVTHTVARGDTLIGLAARYYGDESRWREILSANRASISDPDNLRIGTVLLIPSP
jgi:hypothetical protein